MPGSVQSDFSITSDISLGSQDEVVVAASITTLPLELLLLIVSNLKQIDILNLTITCRALLDSLASARYTRVNFKFDDEGYYNEDLWTKFVTGPNAEQNSKWIKTLAIQYTGGYDPNFGYADRVERTTKKAEAFLRSLPGKDLVAFQLIDKERSFNPIPLPTILLKHADTLTSLSLELGWQSASREGLAITLNVLPSIPHLQHLKLSMPPFCKDRVFDQRVRDQFQLDDAYLTLVKLPNLEYLHLQGFYGSWRNPSRRSETLPPKPHPKFKALTLEFCQYIRGFLDGLVVNKIQLDMLKLYIGFPEDCRPAYSTITGLHNLKELYFHIDVTDALEGHFWSNNFTIGYGREWEWQGLTRNHQSTLECLAYSARVHSEDSGFSRRMPTRELGFFPDFDHWVAWEAIRAPKLRQLAFTVHSVPPKTKHPPRHLYDFLADESAAETNTDSDLNTQISNVNLEDSLDPGTPPSFFDDSANHIIPPFNLNPTLETLYLHFPWSQYKVSERTNLITTFVQGFVGCEAPPEHAPKLNMIVIGDETGCEVWKVKWSVDAMGYSACGYYPVVKRMVNGEERRIRPFEGTRFQVDRLFRGRDKSVLFFKQ